MPLLAAGTVPPFLVESATLIVLGALVAYLCYRAGLVPIVGFLITGVLIGPYQLGLVDNQELVDAMAEIGVILLLFTIGIEFSLEKLAKIKRLIFVGGGLQVGLTTLATMGLLLPFGIPWQIGVYTGFLVALSSTAIVLKLQQERGENNTPAGQLNLGVLIFQDVAIIAMVLLVPVLAGTGDSPLAVLWALTKAALLITAVLVFARRLLPAVLERVARTLSADIFLLTVVAICFGTAYLTSLAGVSVSLGAFLAGLLVSESRFSEHALGEVLPLRILFSAAFFISVGMLLDLSFLITNLPLVLGIVGALLVLKVLTMGVSALVLGFRWPVAAAAGLMMAQVGEFSFVLERVGRSVDLFPGGVANLGSQTFIAATVLLMVLTPLLAELGSRLAGRLERRSMRRTGKAAPAPLPEEHRAIENHVIIAGYGQAARRLVRVLEGSGIPYLIITLNPHAANDAERQGYPVLRGSAARQHTLQHAGIERAKMLVIADDEPTATAHHIVSVARPLNPTMLVLVATRHLAEVEELHHAGADRIISEELERVVGIFDHVLFAYQVSPEEIRAHEERMRRGDYALLRATQQVEEGPSFNLNRERLDTRTLTVQPETPLTGRSPAQLALRKEHEITLRSVRRDETTITDPPADLVFQPGDELTLSGSARAFARSAHLFRRETEESDDK